MTEKHLPLNRETLLEWKEELTRRLQDTSKSITIIDAMLLDFPENPREHPMEDALGNALEEPLGDRPAPGGRRYNSKYRQAADTTCQILRSLGAPTHRAKLYEIMIARGVSIDSNHPETAFASMLTRDRRFSGVSPKGTWGLAEWQAA